MFIIERDCQSVPYTPSDTRPLPYSRDFWKGGYEREAAREVRTLWPAEWRVLVYGAGLPIEQTSSRSGVGISAREVGIDVATSPSCKSVGDVLRCFRDFLVGLERLRF